MSRGREGGEEGDGRSRKIEGKKGGRGRGGGGRNKEKRKEDRMRIGGRTERLG